MKATTVLRSKAVTNASVYGGSTTVTSNDGNDSIVLSSSVSNSYVQGNGGNDTMYVGSSIFGGSSVYGGQGVDLISIVGSLLVQPLVATLVLTPSNSKTLSKAQLSMVAAVLSTTPLSTVPTASALAPLSARALIQANGGADTLYVAGDILGSTVYGGQGADSIQGAELLTSSISGLSLLATVAVTRSFSTPPVLFSIPRSTALMPPAP